MLRNFRIWLNNPLQKTLDSLLDDFCVLHGKMEALQQSWREAETNLDGTYRRVHSELGYIDKRSADLRKLEETAAEENNGSDAPRVPFAGGRRGHARSTR